MWVSRKGVWVLGDERFGAARETLDTLLGGGGVVRSTICASGESPNVTLEARDRGVSPLEARARLDTAAGVPVAR